MMAQFFISWGAAFTIIVTLLYALAPVLHDWPVWLRALVLSGVMVLIMQRLVAPAIKRLMAAGG